MSLKATTEQCDPEFLMPARLSEITLQKIVVPKVAGLRDNSVRVGVESDPLPMCFRKLKPALFSFHITSVRSIVSENVSDLLCIFVLLMTSTVSSQQASEKDTRHTA